MKLTSIILTAFVASAGSLHAVPSLVKAEEQVQVEVEVQDKKILMQIIEDYVVANRGWERGSFYMERNPSAGEGGFSVIKNNSPMIVGGDQNSFLIMVDLKTRKVIGTFAYQ